MCLIIGCSTTIPWVGWVEWWSILSIRDREGVRAVVSEKARVEEAKHDRLKTLDLTDRQLF